MLLQGRKEALLLLLALLKVQPLLGDLLLQTDLKEVLLQMHVLHREQPLLHVLHKVHRVKQHLQIHSLHVLYLLSKDRLLRKDKVLQMHSQFVRLLQMHKQQLVRLP